jgi:hypothetical protein
MIELKVGQHGVASLGSSQRGAARSAFVKQTGGLFNVCPNTEKKGRSAAGAGREVSWLRDLFIVRGDIGRRFENFRGVSNGGVRAACE